MASSSAQTNPSPQPVPTMYTITDTPSKGKGLIASRRIAPGIIILQESPLFKISKLAWIPNSSSILKTCEKFAAAKIKALSPSHQREFLSLHNQHRGSVPKIPPFTATIQTNALPVSATEHAVFVTGSRFNHSCSPNVHYYWDNRSSAQHMVFRSMRKVRNGEELTIDYTGLILRPYVDRQSRLMQIFNFSCICDLCVLPLTRRALIDNSIEEINTLAHKSDLNNADNFERVRRDPKSALMDVKTEIVLMEELGTLPKIVAERYVVAAKIVLMHGDEARAGVMVERAKKLWGLCEGEEIVGAAKLEKVVEGRGGVVSMQWRTGKGDLPRELGSEEFEEWLWRED